MTIPIWFQQEINTQEFNRREQPCLFDIWEDLRGYYPNDLSKEKYLYLEFTPETGGNFHLQVYDEPQISKEFYNKFLIQRFGKCWGKHDSCIYKIPNCPYTPLSEVKYKVIGLPTSFHVNEYDNERNCGLNAINEICIIYKNVPYTISPFDMIWGFCHSIKYSNQNYVEIKNQQGFCKDIEQIKAVAASTGKLWYKGPKNLKKLHASLRLYEGKRSRYCNIFHNYRLTREFLSNNKRDIFKGKCPEGKFSCIKINTVPNKACIQGALIDSNLPESQEFDNCNFKILNKFFDLDCGSLLEKSNYSFELTRNKFAWLYKEKTSSRKKEYSRELCLKVYKFWYYKKLIYRMKTSKFQKTNLTEKKLTKFKNKYSIEINRLFELAEGNEPYAKRFKFLGYLRALRKGVIKDQISSDRMQYCKHEIIPVKRNHIFKKESLTQFERKILKAQRKNKKLTKKEEMKLIEGHFKVFKITSVNKGTDIKAGLEACLNDPLLERRREFFLSLMSVSNHAKRFKRKFNLDWFYLEE